MKTCRCTLCRNTFEARAGEQRRCPYCKNRLNIYQCCSCMKLIGLSATRRDTQCPSCFTLLRSGLPLPVQPQAHGAPGVPLPRTVISAAMTGNSAASSAAVQSTQARRTIVIKVLESPGSGNIVNAKNIWEALRITHDVHIDKVTTNELFDKIFTEPFRAARASMPCDLLILPGWETRLGTTVAFDRVIGRASLVLQLPPPFSAHLFRAPFLWKSGQAKEVDLPWSLPFLPVSKVKSAATAVPEPEACLRLKTEQFPTVKPQDVHFIVTYINLGALTTNVFEKYDVHVIILNFGKHEIKLAGANGKVKSIRMARVSLAEFENYLCRCTTLFPAITDGANTVGTIQALELPYYDLSFPRVLTAKKAVAFLNEPGQKPTLEPFRKLGNSSENAGALAMVAQETRAYYDSNRSARSAGRGARILEIVDSILMARD